MSDDSIILLSENILSQKEIDDYLDKRQRNSLKRKRNIKRKNLQSIYKMDVKRRLGDKIRLFQIFVKPPSGKTETLLTQPNETIGTIRRIIVDIISSCPEFNLNPNRLAMVYGGKNLNNNEYTLNDYKINNESTIHAFWKIGYINEWTGPQSFILL